MTFFKPRIYGLRLAAGVILWFEAAIAVFLAIAMWPDDPAGELPLLLLAVAAVIVGIAIGFWRGNRVARWLAILPALVLLLAAFVYWALSGMCVAGAPGELPQSSGPAAVSCPEPRPERTIGSWLITAGLAASGAIVLVGVFRPGVRET